MMYIPASFSESDRSRLFDFIERYNFGLLVSQMDAESAAVHLPLLLDRQEGPLGTLSGHMARANPQWRAVSRDVLVVFSGPHVYISPGWYEADNVVPTWNYIAVHVYGTMQVLDDEAQTLRILLDSVRFHERTMTAPWNPPEEDAYVRKLAKSVAAFRIEIRRIEGKWKLSQNQPRPRRERVIAALAQRRDDNSRAIAGFMEQALQQEDSAE
jgi:transcriptional regulator